MNTSPFEPSVEAKTDLIHAEAEMLDTMMSEYRSGRWPQGAPWRVVSAEKLTSIWQDAAKLGFVRNEKGLLSIRDRFVENFLRLSVNTVIAGHAEYTYEEELAERLGDDATEAFVDWAVNTDGGWRISDYGLDKLFPLCAAASEATDTGDILMLCDLMLNIAHQRSDLAGWFVDGGQRTLSKLADGERPTDPKPEAPEL
ncbi:hypothetical protein G6L37_35045 [Agrobacterium rubi]|nr:hypothetical protein [Agrobacterium rubi]NTF23787.1 hypothetical protein [Agrobacterium rubi]